MKIFIPVAPNQTIRYETLTSFAMQTKNWPYQRVEGKDFAEENDTEERRIAKICNSRNRCLDLMTDMDMALMHDSDCEMLFPDNIESMIDFLMQNRDFIAVGLLQHELAENVILETPHVACGSWLMRGYMFARLGLRFRYENKHCECLTMCQDIRKSQFRVGYLDYKKRIQNH
jgi:hypothetical protein